MSYEMTFFGCRFGVVMRLLPMTAWAAISLCASAAALGAAPAADTSTRYTFSWLLTAQAPAPRGGSTKGPSVTLDEAPSASWRALQAAGLSKFERDRRAILAMAGTYRVSFDFLEVASFIAPPQPLGPYQSWATEKIYVAEDRGERISLVHILEMRIVQRDGSVSEPFITKHWRQDWTYEPQHVDEYQGGNRWQRRELDVEDARGRWSQTVHQVDESPRYASLGQWDHTQHFSTWISGDTWRPLPRREWSVRKDYNVLIGTNRHTVHATGWLHEENNLKARAERAGVAGDILAREYGIARYERIRDTSFAVADRYYEATKSFWDQVQARWAAVFAERGRVELKGAVDQLGLFMPLFAHADAVAEQGAAASARNSAVIGEALRAMGVE